VQTGGRIVRSAPVWLKLDTDEAGIPMLTKAGIRRMSKKRPEGGELW
jgi:hypothetical protein